MSIYRETRLGKALREALGDMVSAEALPPHLVEVAMSKFDAVIARNLSDKALSEVPLRPPRRQLRSPPLTRGSPSSLLSFSPGELDVGAETGNPRLGFVASAAVGAAR